MSKFNSYARRLNEAAKNAFEKYKKAEKVYQAAEDRRRNMPWNATAEDKTIAEARLIEARNDLKKAQEALSSVAGELKGIRGELAESLGRAFTANPEDIDPNTMELLKSGILTPAEYVKLANGAISSGNNTMLRVIGSYADNNNIYGISYSQNTKGNHTYNIQYNNVTTNGRYAVSLSGTSSLVVNSIIANNVLNTKKSSGNRAVRVGSGRNNTIRNNTDGIFRNNMSDDELPDWLRNHTSVVPSIFVPRYYREGSNGTGLTDDKGNGTAPWNTNGSSGGTNNGNGRHGSGVSGNGSDSNSDMVLGSDRDTAPGVGGDAAPSISAASPGDSGSSAADPNAYEINERNNLAVKSVDYLQLGVICIVALLLLLVGYKRQKDKEEEE